MAKTAMATLELVADPPVLVKWEDGSIRVAGSRLPFDRFVEMAQAGRSLEEMQEMFPSQSLATLHRLTAYYLDHREEVDAWHAAVLARAQALRAEWEKTHPSTEWRKRLKAKLAEARGTGSD